MIISPSILSADFSKLKDDIDTIKNNIEALHIDVMDGDFVPNISFGLPIIKDIRKHYDLIFDVHLMISNPINYIKDFVDAGSDIITIHYESKSDVLKTLNLIKSYGVKVGLSIKPNTTVNQIKEYLPLLDLVLVMSVEPGFGGQSFMPSSIEKIKELSQLKKDSNFNYIIEVDGGINEKTAKLVKEAGVEMLVAGSYIFNAENRIDAINKIKE